MLKSVFSISCILVLSGIGPCYSSATGAVTASNAGAMLFGEQPVKTANDDAGLLGSASSSHVGVVAASRVLLAQAEQEPVTKDPDLAYRLLSDEKTRHQLLAEKDPGNPEHQRNLAASSERLADLQMRMGETDAGLANFKTAVGSREALIKLNSANAENYREQIALYEKLGDIQLQLMNNQQAMDNYNKSLEVALALVKTEPDNMQYKREFAMSSVKTGDLYRGLGQPDLAAEHYLSAQGIVTQMLDKGVLQPEDEWMPGVLESRLESVEQSR